MLEINGSLYDWDAEKEDVNIRKHGITFAEAATVFEDVNIVTIYDAAHSEYEDRFVAIGLSKNINVLTVCHCIRDNEEVIRIISARHATRQESKQYEGGA